MSLHFCSATFDSWNLPPVRGVSIRLCSVQKCHQQHFQTESFPLQSNSTGKSINTKPSCGGKLLLWFKRLSFELCYRNRNEVLIDLPSQNSIVSIACSESQVSICKAPNFSATKELHWGLYSWIQLKASNASPLESFRMYESCAKQSSRVAVAKATSRSLSLADVNAHFLTNLASNHCRESRISQGQLAFGL